MLLKCVVFIALLASGVVGFGQQQEEAESPPSAVASAPTPSIPQQPWYHRPEWVNVFVTGAYVIISGITLFAIWRQADSMGVQTGRMSRQADLMNRQTTIAIESVRVSREAADAAKASADAATAQIQAMKDRERARFQLELTDLDMNPKTPVSSADNRIQWKLTLHGQTEAHDVKGHLIACVNEPEGHPSFNTHWDEMPIPTVISPSNREWSDKVDIEDLTATGDYVNQMLVEKFVVTQEVNPLYVAGCIVFTDVFGERWRLPFRRKWQRMSSAMSFPIRGKWIKEGDNVEQKV